MVHSHGVPPCRAVLGDELMSGEPQRGDDASLLKTLPSVVASFLVRDGDDSFYLPIGDGRARPVVDMSLVREESGDFGEKTSTAKRAGAQSYCIGARGAGELQLQDAVR